MERNNTAGMREREVMEKMMTVIVMEDVVGREGERVITL